MRLDGRTVLITGAGSGIGRALALAAARNGAMVGLVGRRTAPLEAVRGEIGPERAFVHRCDVCVRAERRALVEALRDRFGGLNVLVNNAGMSHAGPIETMPSAAIQEMVATNLAAAVALTADLIPLLRTQAPESRIVNVGSMFGDIAYPLFAVYSATKFGLRGFSDALRRELAPSKIGVTYVAPRATGTAALANHADLIQPFEMKVDTPEDVASRIVDAIRRDAATVYPGAAERFFILVQRLFPALVDRAAARHLARAATRSRDGNEA